MLTMKVNILSPLLTLHSHIETKKAEQIKMVLCYLLSQEKYKELRMCN